MSSLRDNLSSLIQYEPETGLFRWLVARNGYGGGVRPGDIAGTPRDGYVQINICQRVYRAHRLAWLFMTGDFPPKGHEIDHANRDRSDNRWANLRLATRSQNNMNAGLRTDNQSGCRGVSFVARTGKWHARIVVEGKVILLGDFAEKSTAIAARRRAEQSHFGAFAPNG